MKGIYNIDVYCVQGAWDENGVCVCVCSCTCVCVRENVWPLALPENLFGEMKKQTVWM